MAVKFVKVKGYKNMVISPHYDEYPFILARSGNYISNNRGIEGLDASFFRHDELKLLIDEFSRKTLKIQKVHRITEREAETLLEVFEAFKDVLDKKVLNGKKDVRLNWWDNFTKKKRLSR